MIKNRCGNEVYFGRPPSLSQTLDTITFGWLLEKRILVKSICRALFVSLLAMSTALSFSYKALAQDEEQFGVVFQIESHPEAPLNSLINTFPPEWLTPEGQPPRYQIGVISSVEEVERCEYAPSGVVIRLQAGAYATITDLQNDTIVAERQFYGNWPEECADVEEFENGLEERRYGDLNPQEIADWLVAILENAGNLPALVAPEGLILNLFGHTGAAESVSYSPDGTTILTTGEDGLIIFWDAATGERLREFQKDAGSIYYAKYAPDGVRLLIRKQGLFEMWDATTGDVIFQLGPFVSSAVFSPDGTTILTASGDSLALWDAVTGEQISMVAGGLINSFSALYSPDGLTVINTSGSMTFRDTATGEVIREFGDSLSYGAYSPSGTYLITADIYETLQIWDPVTLEPIQQLVGHWAVFSPDERYLVAVHGPDWLISIIDTSTWQVVGELPNGVTSISSLDFSPNGQFLAVALSSGEVELWSIAALVEAE